MSRKLKLTAFEVDTIDSNSDGEYLTMSTMFLDHHSVDLTTNKEDLLNDFREKSRKSFIALQRRHPFLRSHFEFTDQPDLIYLIVSDPDDQSKCESLQIEFVDLTEQSKSPTREELADMCAEFNCRLFDFKKPDQLLWRVQFISYLSGLLSRIEIFKQSKHFIIYKYL